MTNMNTSHKTKPSALYDNAFFEPFIEGAGLSAMKIFSVLHEYYQPERAVDVGCGRGAWVAALRKSGVGQVVGVDGDYVDTDALLFPKSDFVPMDLQAPVGLDQKFDLALSMEVAEHLNPTSSSAFVRFLVSLAPVVLFSAAIPGQPGVGHINARWPSFWVREFEAHGYLALDFIRPRLWHDESVYLHYRQNSLVFVSASELSGNPKLASLVNQPRANCLTLVDEGIIEQQMTLRETFSRLPGQLRRWLFRP